MAKSMAELIDLRCVDVVDHLSAIADILLLQPGYRSSRIGRMSRLIRFRVNVLSVLVGLIQMGSFRSLQIFLVTCRSNRSMGLLSLQPAG